MNAALTLRECGLTREQVFAADLPRNYNAMVVAIKQCDSVDECLTWGNQAKAMESYFKQATDREPFYAMRRIRLRAKRRLGELLNRLESFRGRKEIAKELGTNVQFVSQAKSIARLEDGTFDALVEATPPVTETELLTAATTPRDAVTGGQTAAAQRGIRASRFINAAADVERCYSSSGSYLNLDFLPLTQIEALKIRPSIERLQRFLEELESSVDKEIK